MINILASIKNTLLKKCELLFIPSFLNHIKLSLSKPLRKPLVYQLNLLISFLFIYCFDNKFLRELSELISARRLNCKVDKVSGYVEAERID